MRDNQVLMAFAVKRDHHYFMLLPSSLASMTTYICEHIESALHFLVY